MDLYLDFERDTMFDGKENKIIFRKEDHTEEFMNFGKMTYKEILEIMKVEEKQVKTVHLFINRKPNFFRDDDGFEFIENIYINIKDIQWISKGFPNMPNIKSFSLQSMNMDNLPENIRLPRSIEYINLCSNKMENIPFVIFKFCGLETLNLYNNDISVLPYAIENLKNLQDLNLKKNNLEVVPDVIGLLSNLKRLDLSHNKLKIMPRTIGNLKKLDYLDFSSNPIEYIDPRVFEAENIEWLTITNLNIRFLPRSISQLKKLRMLTISKPRDMVYPNFPPESKYFNNLLYGTEITKLQEFLKENADPDEENQMDAILIGHKQKNHQLNRVPIELIYEIFYECFYTYK